MAGIHVQFLGSGDAFGSGGRFQTCILVEADLSRFLIDCGASSLIALKQRQVSTADIDFILLTHLHGDHYGGIPFFLIDAKLVSKRTKPLIIAGPTGLEDRIHMTNEAFFPGTLKTALGFALTFVDLKEEETTAIGETVVTPFLAKHPSEAPSFALRIECRGKIIAYSGDTGWTDALIDASAGADLFICESNYYDTKAEYHLDYLTIMKKRDSLKCKRLVLTHMSDEMLGGLSSIDAEYAEDGKIITI
jgi:ribonuclease BN (tRNA processing enzyme)